MVVLFFGYHVIDMHAHLRQGKFVPKHARTAKIYDIDIVVAMANCQPCNDNVKRVSAYKKLVPDNEAYPMVLPVAAITVGREGKELVDIEALKPHPSSPLPIKGNRCRILYISSLTFVM